MRLFASFTYFASVVKAGVVACVVLPVVVSVDVDSEVAVLVVGGVATEVVVFFSHFHI